MESNNIVSVSDINKKRSSLKNNTHCEEMKKLFNLKKDAHLQFDLDTIKETDGVSTEVYYVLLCFDDFE